MLALYVAGAQHNYYPSHLYKDIMTVKISTLSNGLRVATDTMAEAESVMVGVWISVGSRHEPKNANGVAHMTEHMLFKGTKKRSAYKISKIIEDKGGMLNAHTSREETAYYARVMPEDTERATDVIADMMLNSVFDEKELRRERQVVVQEIGRDLDTPEDHVYDLLLETAYPNHALGRPILGKANLISRMPRKQITGYVKKHYHTGNTVLIASGKIEHKHTVELAEKYFAAIPKGREVKIEKAKFKKGELRKHKDSEQLHLMIAFPAPSMHANKTHVAALLGTLLGGSSSSRLFQKVREKRGLVYNIATYALPFQDSGMFCLYAGTDPKCISKLIPIVCKEMIDVTQNISLSELKRAKAGLRSDFLMGQESVMRRGEMLGQQMLTYGKASRPDKILKKIESITVDETQDMAKKIFSKPPVITTLGDADKLEDYKIIRDRLV